MKIVLKANIELIFDIYKTENEKEQKMAKILLNHLSIDIENENHAFCYAQSKDMVDDILKENIDEQTYNKCISEFEKRGWIKDYGDGIYEFISSEETRILDKTGRGV